MPFSDLMTDRIDLQKKDGTRVSNQKASVQKSRVFMDAGQVVVESGDVIVRRLSNGTEETYEVIDPGFNEKFGGIPAHYQMDVRKVAGAMPNSGLPQAPTETNRPPTMKVFVSHSSADAAVAEALVEVLRAGLNLGSKDIRCTSVNGYKLPAGAESDQQLRTEVFGCGAFLALLSPKSIKSIYVMFEMGARWGAHKFLVPILVKGTKPGDLKPPLSAIHAIDGQSEPELHQLLADVGKQLGLEIEKQLAYHKPLKQFINQSRDDWI